MDMTLLITEACQRSEAIRAFGGSS